MSLLKIYAGPALQKALREIIQPVEIIYQHVDQPEPDTMSALADLDSMLAAWLTIHLHSAPTAATDRLLVRNPDQNLDLTFIGPPLGTELAALVSAIIIAGRGKSGLAAATQQRLKTLTEPTPIQVFTTPT